MGFLGQFFFLQSGESEAEPQQLPEFFLRLHTPARALSTACLLLTPSVEAQSVPGWVPSFHGILVVAVHIWSLDSEALPAGPAARARPHCPLFAQLKRVNWNEWPPRCRLARRALLGTAAEVWGTSGPARIAIRWQAPGATATSSSAGGRW